MFDFDRLVSWTDCPGAISPLIECRELENGGRGLFAVTDIPVSTPLTNNIPRQSLETQS